MNEMTQVSVPGKRFHIDAGKSMRRTSVMGGSIKFRHGGQRFLFFFCKSSSQEKSVRLSVKYSQGDAQTSLEKQLDPRVSNCFSGGGPYQYF